MATIMSEDKLADVEAGHNLNADVVFKNLDFTEDSIRRGFIRKVYSLLTAQLAFTLLVVFIFMGVTPVKSFIFKNGLIFVILAIVTMFVTIIVMHCSTDMRRKSPHNYILLSLFTLSLAFVCGVISAACEKQEVFLALGLCTVITVFLTVFAWQTKYDFTTWHTGLSTLLLVLVIVGCAALFVEPTEIVHLVLAGAGAVLFSLLLIYDTQKIIGGRHKLSISPEEYVFAATTLYLDIVNIFLRILRLTR